MLITLDIAEDKAEEFLRIAEPYKASVVDEADEEDYEVDFDDPTMPEWHKVELRKRLANHDPSTDMPIDVAFQKLDKLLADHAAKV